MSSSGTSTRGAERAGAPPALEARDVSKSFGANLVLDKVSFTVAQGDVVALLGENGSGKSTLVKILAGYHAPEAGSELYLAGRRVPLPLGLGEFREVGLAFVFQDLGLAGDLRVVENLFVGARTARSGRSLRPIEWRSEARAARRLLSDYGVDLDPLAPVAALSPTEQALVAIVRAAEDLAAYRRRSGAAGGVLVLDEPTVFLPEAEKVFLFDLIERVAADGTAVVFVSHDFSAVRAVAHRAIVLRDGHFVADVEVAATSDEELVGLITGTEPGTLEAEAAAKVATAAPTRSSSPVALAVEKLSTARLHEVSFELHAGEILGVAGLLGSGSEELAYGLFGALEGTGGKVRTARFEGDLARLSPRRAIAAGFALVPADRARQAAVTTLPVETNLLSLVLGDYVRGGFLAHRRMREVARERGAVLALRPGDPSVHMAALSGGNQQKVVLAKWMERRPEVLLLHEPTQGVDVGTRTQIYRIVDDLAAAGTAVLWVTTDFNELAAVSHRILVCAGGRIAKELLGPGFTRDEISAEVYATSVSTAVVR